MRIITDYPICFWQKTRSRRVIFDRLTVQSSRAFIFMVTTRRVAIGITVLYTLCVTSVTMSGRERAGKANERMSERRSVRRRYNRVRDAKGDVKLETKRVDAERQSERKKREARYERIDVMFVNLSEKDTEMRGTARPGRRVEKRKTKGVTRVCHSLNLLLSGLRIRCIPLHARTLFHARIIYISERRRTHGIA